MLDDIDYSSLTASETPSEKKKEQGIVSRRMKSEKTSNVAQAKPIDVNAIVEKSQQLSNDLGAPKAAEGLSNYGTEILGGLGALGALAAAHHHYTSSQKKYGETTAGAPPEGMTLKQDMRNIGQLAPVAPPPVIPSLAPETKYSPEIQALIERSEINKAVKAADAAARANPLPVGATPGFPSAANPMDQLTIQPPAPQLMQPKPPVGAVPPAPPPAPPAAPSVGQAVATGGNVTQAVNQTVADLIDQPPEELRTGTNKPAYAGQGPAAEIRTKGKKAGEPMLRNSYAKIEDVPAGYAFVPGAQNIDTSRTNIGQTEYTKAYTNRPFPLTNDLAMQESSEINRLLGRPTREEAKAAGLTLPPQTPGITKHVLETKGTPFMGTKAAKVGGILGALIAIPDLAKAETAGQRGMAGANMLEAVLPPGFTMMGAGEGSTLPANIQQQQNAAMLLGSPYAQSDIAKKRRADEQYARQVGGGRGIAPPSAYKR